MMRLGLRPENPRTLDIGSGAGHWISFYLDVLQASQVVGVEIAQPCVDALRRKFAASPSVRVELGDVSSDEFNLGVRFDIINAIGVMFHIVDDAAWMRALRNLREHLNDGGVLIVGGQFGLLTRNVQFHDADRFDSWDELRSKSSDVALVNKRIRSYRMWRRGAQEVGLQIRRFQRTRRSRWMWTPENNLLLLQKNG
jgi:cyclopropane fatty-acyl-phospholipid synthase-like methyltransferase